MAEFLVADYDNFAERVIVLSVLAFTVRRDGFVDYGFTDNSIVLANFTFALFALRLTSASHKNNANKDKTLC
jgi:hypothetical protein